jgi:hypothetical protein
MDEWQWVESKWGVEDRKLVGALGSREVHTVDMDALSTLNPYRTAYINRFGNYLINPDRIPESLERHMGHSLAPVSA